MADSPCKTHLANVARLSKGSSSAVYIEDLLSTFIDAPTSSNTVPGITPENINRTPRKAFGVLKGGGFKLDKCSLPLVACSVLAAAKQLPFAAAFWYAGALQ